MSLYESEEIFIKIYFTSLVMKSTYLYSPAQWDDINCDPVVLIRP